MKPSIFEHSFASQKGTSVTEMLWILPAVAVVIVLFIGLGWTLMLRQEGLVAARFAAFYQQMSNQVADSAQVSQCVSPHGDRWKVTPSELNVSSEINGAGAGVGGGVEGAFDSFVSTVGGKGAVAYHAEAVPQLGTVPSLLHPGRAMADYTLPTGTWTDDGCGPFATILNGTVSFFSSLPSEP